jgi:hypothetical protein
MFEQSAQILAEVGKSSVKSGLIGDNKLEEIVWAIQTKYARDIWDSPPSGDDCDHPSPTHIKSLRASGQAIKVVDFKILPSAPKSAQAIFVANYSSARR